MPNTVLCCKSLIDIFAVSSVCSIVAEWRQISLSELWNVKVGGVKVVILNHRENP